MRNVAVAVLRQLGFGGTEVAAVIGLTPNYVATLALRSLREGTAGLIRAAGRGRPARRRGTGPGRGGRPGCGRGDRAAAGGEPVHGAAQARPAHVQEALPLTPAAAAEPGAGEHPGRGTPGRGTSGHGAGASSSRDGARPGSGPATAAFSSRCAGAMLLHAFFARRPPGRCSPAPPGRRTWRC